MNCISNIPDLALYWLQQQNITKKITKLPNKLHTEKIQTSEVDQTTENMPDSNENITKDTNQSDDVENIEQINDGEIVEQINETDASVLSTSTLDEPESTIISETQTNNVVVSNI
jgi:cbb3-type cytochrome oxidase cytochrome c subunit